MENGVDIKGGDWRAGRDVGSFQIPLVAPKYLGPENTWHYFHPGRVDCRYAPDWFRTALHVMDPRLEVIWHPVLERWAVWCKNERISHKFSPGWQFLFPWLNPTTNAYLPLDERVFANIYHRSPRKWGDGKQYWDRIEGEILRDKQKKEEARQDEARTLARDYWDSKQIKVSMCGPSNGSKFVNGQ